MLGHVRNLRTDCGSVSGILYPEFLRLFLSFVVSFLRKHLHITTYLTCVLNNPSLPFLQCVH